MQTKRALRIPGQPQRSGAGVSPAIGHCCNTGAVTTILTILCLGNLFLEDGFRDFSKSHVGQLFGKVGYLGTHADFSLSLTHVNNKLTGNGPLPEGTAQT